MLPPKKGCAGQLRRLRELTLKTATILVVDDQPTHRKKIELAVTALGYDVATASSAAGAISHLKNQSVDMLLLDIEMPEADGYSVQEWMNQQPQLKHIPVVVISAHDGNSEMVIKAIKLGAEDFLPKNFAIPILKARITASIQKKQNRDAEIKQAYQIERLTRASELLEQSIYNPTQLRLNSIASGSTPMATFASVFSTMAQKIYDRERRLKHQAQTLRSFGLLLLTGLLFGLDAPIAKWLSQFNLNSIGMTIWLSAILVILTIPRAIYKKCLPKPSLYVIGYFLLWGACTTLLGDLLLLKASEHIQASVITVIMVTEVLMVYTYSAMTKLESTNAKKITGVLLGFLGVILVVFALHSDGGSTSALWAFIALGVPLGYAVIDIMIAVARKVDVDPLTTLGLAAISGIVILLPIAWLQDGFVPLSTIPVNAAIGILFWSATTLGSMLVFVYLVRTAGPVFGSQTAYVQTIAGIGLSFFF